ncbi:MRN complex-interacting protein isoform X2 [Melanotaenia boesemani]|uniref:MRN complex-interacting protein isoform X2 n=1 Tax=Melanotaenia boesemani TaxID=1250792 RepID=UPI001C043536|nr:MRN complex-interacting protein isoform X2 [Melanotaenia boesemani]
MVQEFHVVRCFSCLSFQVHQVKKENRWTCKLCGQKQSLLKEFGRGSGADCRRHVQKLNAMRGAMLEEQQHNTWLLCEQEDGDEEEGEEEPRDKQVGDTQVSRWSKYLHPAEEVDPEEEEPRERGMMDRQHLHGNRSSCRKRKRPEDEGQDNIYTPAQPHRPDFHQEELSGKQGMLRVCWIFWTDCVLLLT